MLINSCAAKLTEFRRRRWHGKMGLGGPPGTGRRHGGSDATLSCDAASCPLCGCLPSLVGWPSPGPRADETPARSAHRRRKVSVSAQVWRPELLTRRSRILASAVKKNPHVGLFDHLGGAGCWTCTATEAERIYVGKEPGHHESTAAEINRVDRPGAGGPHAMGD